MVNSLELFNPILKQQHQNQNQNQNKEHKTIRNKISCVWIKQNGILIVMKVIKKKPHLHLQQKKKKVYEKEYNQKKQNNVYLSLMEQIHLY